MSLLTWRWPAPWIARAFAIAVVLLSMALIGWTARVAYPAQLADSSDLERVERAAGLDPSNDSIQHALGLMERWNNGSRESMLKHLRLAIALNPNRPEYWADLGQACFVSADEQCAEANLSRAVQFAPKRPRLRWNLATFYVVSGQRDSALRTFSELLTLSPGDSADVLNLCLRAYEDPILIWNKVVRPSQNVAAEFTMLALIAGKNLGDTRPLWEEARKSNFNLESAAPYVDALVAHGYYDLAQQVWNDMEHASVVPASDAHGIYNGDFEVAPLNIGFDWHLDHNAAFVQSLLDSTVVHDGTHSLRIDFTVASNSEFSPVYQIVPVGSAQRYVLTAWMKSVDITSDSGPRLRVEDAQCESCLDVASDETSGTTDWHRVQVSFTTGRMTKAVRISVWRSRSRSYPMDISGTLWLDSVSLATASTTPQASQ